MKGTTILCLLLFLAMLCIPFLAIGANLSGSLPDSPRVTDSGPPAELEKASFRIRDESTNEILTVGDRDFLYGAIVTEMAPSAEPEALKAQAVAAYTYYSRQRALAREQNADSDFSADPQNWKVYVSKEQMQERWGESFQGYYDKLTEVIDCIAGQTLQSDGELIDATYFAISSGKTESSEDVWGGKLDYLVPVASPGDLFASGYQTTASFSAEEFRNAIQEKAPDADFSGDPSTWVGEAACTNSGSVKQITIGGQPVDGDDVRSVFGLRSSNFTLACADSIFTFTVRGYGHGVGMSQTGAQFMAQQGSDYQEILAWYYPNTTLVSV